MNDRTAWTTRSTAAIRTGTWRAAMPRHAYAPSPCHAACPVHGEIATWIGHARDGDFKAAWHALARHNPFPAVIGRVCHHPCESACNRAGVDGALSIRQLERRVGDVALEHDWSFDAPPAAQRERIAIVGGGPSGLSAAFQLRRRGYGVTVFESSEALGGVMRHGIPRYRLPRAVLDAEIARIVALGVEVRCSRAVTSPQALAALRESFDAVYLAVGAGMPKRLPAFADPPAWMLDGADYLARSARGAPPELGPRVVVIGGGSAAMDVARSARRAGHAVTVLSLEARDAMPAQPEEVVEALEEGIVLHDAALMLDVAPQAGGTLRLACGAVGCDRRFTLDADAIVTAIGQDPDLAPFEAACASEARLLKADALGATGADRVWAGGDLTSAARFVSEAIAAGERAARDIDLQLRGGAHDPIDLASSVGLAAINLHYHPARARTAERRRGVAERLADAGEVQCGLSIEEAVAEAARCFSCGTCTHCDNCITYCPDIAVRRAGDGYEVLGDYCKGCGLCVRECPTGSIGMREEVR